jgi:asparagine synthase (glutamine-hydrolysing)
MFAIIAAKQGGVVPQEIAAMADALLGGQRPATLWCDDEGRAAAAGTVFGALAEDRFCRQPFVSDDLVFVAQARIDNRDDILTALGIDRARRDTLSDNEVAYLAYERWGEESNGHLTGDYAYVAWHRRTGRVVASIGHTRAVRLYYTVRAGRFIASTQLGALLVHRETSHALNLRALGLLIAPLIEPGSTPYADIYALASGEMVVYDGGALERRRWWRPDTEVRVRYRDPRDYVLHARELFDCAVRACLRSDTGVSTTMSGGLDSTLVATTAAAQLRQTGGTVTAYTSVPEPGLARTSRLGWDDDDWPYAAAVAAMHDNMRHVSVTPGGLSALDIVPAIHARSRTPVRNGANHIWLGRISELTAQSGRRVLLIGEMGNATISASGQGALRDLVVRFRWREALRHASAQAGQARSPAWRVLAKDILGAQGMDALRSLAGRKKPDDRIGKVFFTSAFRGVSGPLPSHPPFGGRAGNHAFALLARSPWSADPIAQWGVEWRDPTADRRLTECLLSFPLDAFVAGGRDRGLARSMGEGLVPDIVRDRRTRGAQAPETLAMIMAHATTYRAALERAAGSEVFRSIVDSERLRAALEDILAGVGDLSAALTVDRALDVGLFIAVASPEGGDSPHVPSSERAP